jgi:hypothetical protein
VLKKVGNIAPVARMHDFESYICFEFDLDCQWVRPSNQEIRETMVQGKNFIFIIISSMRAIECPGWKNYSDLQVAYICITVFKLYVGNVVLFFGSPEKKKLYCFSREALVLWYL